jgi:hypothetical protein
MRKPMTLLRWIAFGYTIALGFAALLNYIPGLTDEQGRSFGIFALDTFDDLLHVASASWAAVAAWMSHRASKLFLRWFGTLYLLDGVMGLAVGSGYLDFGIFKYGVQDFDFMFKIFANTPHIGLGGFALFASLLLDRSNKT